MGYFTPFLHKMVLRSIPVKFGFTGHVSYKGTLRYDLSSEEHTHTPTQPLVCARVLCDLVTYTHTPLQILCTSCDEPVSYHVTLKLLATYTYDKAGMCTLRSIKCWFYRFEFMKCSMLSAVLSYVCAASNFCVAWYETGFITWFTRGCAAP